MRTLPFANVLVLSFVDIIESRSRKQNILSGYLRGYRYSHSFLLNLLTFVSFCYLVFPVIIFILGFVRIEISAVLIGLTAFVCYRSIHTIIGSEEFKLQAKNALQEWRLWRWNLLLVGGLTLAWLSFSSIGGIGYRNFDSGIRSSLLWHLVTGSWPLYFPAGYFGDTFGVVSDKAYVYYFAYYLPAAVGGKLLGWKMANLTLFAYSWLGVWLALMFVRMYVQQRGRMITLLVFTGICLFGGMDYVFNRLLAFTADRSEMWLSPFHYFSHTRNLFWAPQHCLPSWLMIGVALNWRQVSPLLMRIFPLVIVSILLWSPLCLIGIVPFLFPVIKWYWKEWLRLNVQSVLTCLVFILLVAFIISNDFSFKMFLAPYSVDNFWGNYSLLILTEFAILSIIFFLNPRQIFDFNILATALSMLFVIPIFILGTWNDWSIKLSMPSLFVLSILVIKQIIYLMERRSKTVWISVLIFGAGVFTPLEELVYSAEHYRIAFESPPEIREFGPTYIVWQQLGDPGNFFFRIIARR
jgi:hypothetical protein